MILSDSEFLQLAMNSYDNPRMSFIEEFENDIKRFTSINVMVSKYLESSENINLKLLINHLIILENCFTLPILLKMLDYKIYDKNKSIVQTILFYMEKLSVCKNGLNYNILELLNEDQRRN